LLGRTHLGPHQILDVRDDVLDPHTLGVTHPEYIVLLIGFRCTSGQKDWQGVFDVGLLKRDGLDCEWRDGISLLSKLLRHDSDDHTDSQSLMDDMSDASSSQNLPT
jgi:hypothetical protein